MSQYVLTLSVGPVQDFIAAARRSRDLWCGSWLLSEIAKAAAYCLFKSQKVELIFPYIKHDLDLKPDSEFSVGNKIQAVCHCSTAKELNELAEAAKAAAKKRFADIAEQARQSMGSNRQVLREDIWQQQIDDYVEVQFAWAQIENDDYQQACKKSARLLGARKATRDFMPNPSAQPLPKSSLDGARETVLPEDGEQSSDFRRVLGLNTSEQLDCAGVVKRLGGNTEQFTPITRVAADSWLRTLSDKQLTELRDAYKPLVGVGLATEVKGNKGIYTDFPYDAQLLYRSRLEAETSQLKKQGLPENQDYSDKLKNLKDVLLNIYRQKGEPCTYWVMLLADGDRMGALLDQAKDAKTHQEITQALSNFASDVDNIMRRHRGHRIYSGGDDVLGLLPLDNAEKCAKELSDTFCEKLQSVAQKLEIPEQDRPSPSLSVGLAICHFLTPLGTVRALAKRAEKTSKGDTLPKKMQRNALGITLAVRSGSTSDLRVRWDDEAGLQALDRWKQEYSSDKGGLSSRIAYDCRRIFLETDFPQQDTDLYTIRHTEFLRMLKKARTPQGGELSTDLIQSLKERFENLKDLNALATELIIARWLAAKTQGFLGREA